MQEGESRDGVNEPVNALPPRSETRHNLVGGAGGEKRKLQQGPESDGQVMASGNLAHDEEVT